MEQGKKNIPEIKNCNHYYISKSIAIYSITFVAVLIISLFRLFVYKDYGWLVLFCINVLVFVRAFNYLLVNQRGVFYKTFIKTTCLEWGQVKQVKNNFPYITLLPVSFAQERKLHEEFLDEKFENDYDIIQVCPKSLVSKKDMLKIIRENAINARFDEGIERLFYK